MVKQGKPKANRLEDYEPGVTKEEAHAALLKVAQAPNPSPKRGRIKKLSAQPQSASS